MKFTYLIFFMMFTLDIGNNPLEKHGYTIRLSPAD